MGRKKIPGRRKQVNFWAPEEDLGVAYQAADVRHLSFTKYMCQLLAKLADLGPNREWIPVAAPARLHAAAEKAAQERGMTVPELICELLARETGEAYDPDEEELPLAESA